MDRTEQIIARTGDLPSLPHLALKIIERLRDPNISTNDLEALVSRDPALASLVALAGCGEDQVAGPTTDDLRAQRDALAKKLASNATKAGPKVEQAAPVDPAENSFAGAGRISSTMGPFFEKRIVFSSGSANTTRPE